MKRVLRYGLTTALRGFDEPQEWNGNEDITISGATILSDVITEQGRALSLATMPGAETVNITRAVSGNCRTNIELLVTKGCNVKITERISGEGTLQSAVILNIEKSASADYTIAQEMSENSVALLNYQAHTNHSNIKWLFIGLGGETTQAFISTVAGERSEAVNNAVIVGTGRQQFDIHSSTIHSGEGSSSDMLTRAVMGGNSRLVSHGLIRIESGAKDCDSYQKTEALIISDGASADAIPNLEINDHRVKCSHGASIGKLDEEKMFYLQSRGIKTREAARMITHGMLSSLLTEEWLEKVSEKLDSAEQ